jgi:predicted dehydrogenase
MHGMNRRVFLRRSAAGLALGASARSRYGLAASEKISVGLMGCGGRGNDLIAGFARRADVAVKYLCDVDARQFGRVAKTVEGATGKAPRQLTDFRRMLEDPGLDAVIVATPDHWHALATVMGCQAGKHVFVEKLVSQNVWEGRKMVEAARKYKRVVQAGLKTRGGAYTRKAVDFVHGGKLGRITLVHCYHMVGGGGAPATLAKVPVPEGMNWDMYCGPGPLLDYRAPHKRLLGQSWDFNAGPIFGDGVHQLDAVRWIIGKGYPKAVHHEGGIYAAKDGSVFPDTENITYEYDDLLFTFHGSRVTPSMKKIPYDIRDLDVFPEWLSCGTKVMIYGDKAMMAFGRHGGGWQAWGPDGKVLSEQHGPEPTNELIDDFVECVKSGKRPICDIEEGHISSALCHLANISFRLGNRKLRFDAATQRCPDDAEACALLRRKDRAPWVIPDKV